MVRGMHQKSSTYLLIFEKSNILKPNAANYNHNS